LDLKRRKIMPGINFKPGISQKKLTELGYKPTPLAMSDITNLNTSMSYKVDNATFQAFLDVLDAQASCIAGVHYYKETAPTGTGIHLEKCVCADGKIYTYITDHWHGENMLDGDRYWHFKTGSDRTGNSGTKDPGPGFKLYEWDSTDEGELLEDSVTFGTFAAVEQEGTFMWYNGFIVEEMGGSVLTTGELAAINNASLVNTDTVAKTSDIPAPQLTSNEVTAINNASLGSSDTVAKTNNIFPTIKNLFSQEVTNTGDYVNCTAVGAGKSWKANIKICNTHASNTATYSVQQVISATTVQVVYAGSLAPGDTVELNTWITLEGYLKVKAHDETLHVIGVGVEYTAASIREIKENIFYGSRASGGTTSLDSPTTLTCARIVGDLQICVNEAGTAVVDVARNEGASDISIIKTTSVGAGNTFLIENIVLETDQYLKITATTKGVDYLFWGYKE
jgi:hypothetical protein